MAKPFAWSFSKFKNFETCPRRHHEVDLLKRFKEEEGEPLKYGNALHKAMGNALGKAIALPTGKGGDGEYDFTFMQKWVGTVLKSCEANNAALLVEQQYAVDANLNKCAWFAPNAWLRAIVDVLQVGGRVALARDWKTGAQKPDSVQLALTAQVVFAHFPDLEAVATQYVWLQDNETTDELYTRAKLVKLWPGIMERVDRMRQAWDFKVYPPTPSGLCVKYCPVTTCQFHGKGSRG